MGVLGAVVGGVAGGVVLAVGAFDGVVVVPPVPKLPTLGAAGSHPGA
jgi:hypothetical protein